MERLTDFKPLAQLSLPDIGDVACRGLILLVGPNSSGKTQLLRDISRELSGQVRQGFVVARGLDVARPPNFRAFVDCLNREGFVQLIVEGGGEFIRPATSHAGIGEAAQQLSYSVAEGMWSQFDSARSRSAQVDFLVHFGRMVLAQLFLERRLTAVTQVSNFDYESTAPQNDLQAMHINEVAHSALQGEIASTFAKAIWLDPSRGNILCFKVGDSPAALTSVDRQRPRQMGGFRTIESEGDGLKSYVAIAVALLLGRRPVCLIDEPEMCLHPPQATRLGRFIASYGASTDRVTFVATHSSHIVRGIIQQATDFQILRLTRPRGTFRVDRIEPSELRQVFAKPAVRAEAVLDGLFAEAAVIVEADTDRMVYQAAWQAVRDDFSHEFHVLAVGGIGGIAQVCGLYRRLRIPVAVIADLDLVTNLQQFEAVVRALSDEQTATRLAGLARPICVGLKALPPTISRTEAAQLLNDANKVHLDWIADADEVLHEKLSRLANRLNRMGRIKRGGVFSLPRHVRRPLVELIEEASAIGLFLVHVGELEGWLAGKGVKTSRDDKPGWANEAASFLESSARGKGDVWAFVARVGMYLERIAAE
jgi:AAA domain, putative AbiEii toxin, Type IV TA system